MSLQEGVATLGGSSCVKNFTQTSQFEQCSNSKHQVLFGSHILSLFRSVVTVPSSVIIYNLEQVGETRWMTPAMISLLQQHKVWDYSLKNVEELQKKDISVEYIPISFSNSSRIFNQSQVQDFDVLLVGGCHPRRCQIIKQLQQLHIKAYLAGDSDDRCKSCKHYILPSVYGNELERLLVRVKTHLNIHYFDVGIFEIVRVSYLLSNSMFVISEMNGESLSDEEKYFSSGLLFRRYEEIVPTVVKYLEPESVEERKRIAKIGSELMSQRLITPYLRCQLFAQKTYF
jgi:hypothetical protein